MSYSETFSPIRGLKEKPCDDADATILSTVGTRELFRDLILNDFIRTASRVNKGDIEIPDFKDIISDGEKGRVLVSMKPREELGIYEKKPIVYLDEIRRQRQAQVTESLSAAEKG